MPRPLPHPRSRRSKAELQDWLAVLAPEVAMSAQRIEAEWKFAVHMRLLAMSVARELQQEEAGH
jgi:hypothetical protein